MISQPEEGGALAPELCCSAVVKMAGHDLRANLTCRNGSGITRGNRGPTNLNTKNRMAHEHPHVPLAALAELDAVPSIVVNLFGWEFDHRTSQREL